MGNMSERSARRVASITPPLANRLHSKTMRLDILPDALNAPAVSVNSGIKNAGIRSMSLSVDELTGLFENAYDATLITDVNGYILQGNQRAHEFLCTPGKTLAGMNVINIISGAEAELVRHLVDTLDTERYVRIHAWSKDGRGSFFPTEIAVHKIETAYMERLCFFIRDITWRKEAEDRLQIIDTAVRTARAGIAMLDTYGTITYANPAMNTLCGLAHSENLVGRGFAEFFADRAQAIALCEYTSNGDSWRGQIELRHADGRILTVDCEAAPSTDTDGDYVGAVVSLADISDTLRAREAERTIERNRVMIESIGTVCHHLGQPSTVLLNSIEMLRNMEDVGHDAAERKELLELSLAAAESLGELLRELNELRTYRPENYANTDNIIAIAAGGSDAES